MKVSGSILAVNSDYFEYARALQYANVNYIHIDIFQGGMEFIIKDCLNFDSS